MAFPAPTPGATHMTANANDGSGWFRWQIGWGTSIDGSAHGAGASSAVPEPVRLYELFYLALLVHRPCSAPPGARCLLCEQPWPCPKLRLAYRLREGFYANGCLRLATRYVTTCSAGSTWLALTPSAMFLLWSAWWSWSRGGRQDDLRQAAMGKHHRPESELVWPRVAPDESVDHVNPVRPHVQDTLSTSIMRTPVCDDDTPTVPNAVHLAGLKAIERLGFGTAAPGEHGKYPYQSTGLRHDRHSDGL